MSDQVILALLTMITTISLAIVAGIVKVYADVRVLHKAVNSRLDELIATTRKEAHAAGVVEGTGSKVINPPPKH